MYACICIGACTKKNDGMNAIIYRRKKKYTPETTDRWIMLGGDEKLNLLLFR